jgi:enamine deaminase RidA (YjgF/YER057c/UK114 family)
MYRIAISRGKRSAIGSSEENGATPGHATRANAMHLQSFGAIDRDATRACAVCLWHPAGPSNARRSEPPMIKRLETGLRMSQAAVHGNTIYLAGQVAEDPSADVTGQTRQILASIDRLLAAAGSDKTRILSATIYLADIGTFAQMNSAWDAWVPAGHTPARATVEARLAAPHYKVEIQVIAAA